MLPLSLLLLLALQAPVAVPAKLHGRFLHLTDMHPDPFYLFNASVDAACHSTKPHKGERSGYWGTPVSDCDSPIELINTTFDFLKSHFHPSSASSPIDFVVWTGDNARHDIDSRTPRSLPEIFALNRDLARRVRDAFGNIPVVANIGNNASSITTEFLSIWKHFIPETHKHTFARGGYYSVPAAGNTLLLVSLNTMYMYENNKAVDGCPVFDESGGGGEMDPGREQLLWLEQQLLLSRTGGRMVWLTGHVPPTESNWYPRCLATYSELVLRFHDTIVGQLFGHMNIDHFTFIQPRSSSKSLPSSSPSSSPSPSSLSSNFLDSSPSYDSTYSDHEIEVTSKADSISSSLLSYYSSLPPRHKNELKGFAAVHVSPSVIPTYLPSLRVWMYNVSEDSRWRQPPDDGMAVLDDVDDEDEEEKRPNFLDTLQQIFSPPSSTLKKKKRKKKKHPRPPVPTLPQHFSPFAPSMTNRFLTPLGYTQLSLDLVSANENAGYGPGKLGRRLRDAGGVRPAPEWSVEYTTFDSTFLARGLLGLLPQDAPVAKGLFGTEVADVIESGGGVAEVSERVEEWCPYSMPDGTVGEWVRLGRRIGKGGETWRGFLERVFVSSGDEE